MFMQISKILSFTRSFLVATLIFSLPVYAFAVTPWFQDGFEWSDVATAISSGPYNDSYGDVSLSSTYAHSGTKSAKICYHGNEDQSYIQFDVPGMKLGSNNGATHIFLRWWELRAPGYDWSGEKFNRIMGLQSNGNLTLDYPLGWVAEGGWGQPGTNDAGPIQMFGNSKFSNGANIWSYSYRMPREEWHAFEYEIKLNDVGSANGETRLWIDDQLVKQVTNVELRYANHTLDRVWMGGWYSGGNNPEPSPACRYVDDVAASTQKIGMGSGDSTGGDTIAPVVSSISASNIGQTYATISATTNEPTDFQVEYGKTTSYGSVISLDSSLVTNHSAALTSLEANTNYHYRLRARDAAGNLAVSSDHTFSSLSTSTASASECSNWETLHPEWIWCDDFDSGIVSVGKGQYFEYDDNGGEFVPLSGLGLNNSYGMRAKWQLGETSAGNLKIIFGRNPIGDNDIRSSDDFRDLFYRVYVRTQAGWTGDPEKFSRATVFSASDWSQAMIAHVWSPDSGGSTLAIDPVSCVSGSTVNCVGYNDFNHLQWLGLKSGQTQLFSAANANSWYCVESHIRLNDPGQSNGVQEFWVNGQSQARSSNLNFVGTYTNYGLNAIFLENFWNDGSPQEQERYFDNLVISTQPIGCASQSGTIAPPMPPSGLM